VWTSGDFSPAGYRITASLERNWVPDGVRVRVRSGRRRRRRPSRRRRSRSPDPGAIWLDDRAVMALTPDEALDLMRVAAGAG
jgi:hypothetical protein